MHNSNLYNNSALLQEFIWHSIKDLPKESVDEILSFMLYVRKKNYHPELFDIEYEILNDELLQKSINETQHLEMEFANYKNKFPNE